MKLSSLKNKLILTLAPIALCLALAGCGNSGAGAFDGTLPASSSSSSSSSTSSGAGVSTVSKITLFGDSTVLGTAKDKPVEVTAVVTSADNVAIAGKNVIFSVTDSALAAGVRLEVVSATTDKSGLASARLFLLNDLTERDVKIVAKYADAVPAEFAVRVAGNSLVISGPAQLPLNGEPSQYTIQLKDSAGKPVANQEVKLTSKAGNPVSLSTAKTDVAGQVGFTVKGGVSGKDTVSASALGVSGARDFTVSGENLAVSVPSNVVVINQDGLVTVSYVNSAAIPAGAVVTMTTTAGQVRAVGAPLSASAASATAPISSGSATFNVRSSSTGPATLSALINGTVSTSQINFVSVTPSTISVQPSPAIIGPNLGTGTSQRSQLVAIVRDNAGNPVAGKTVAFSAVENPSGGRIEPSVAITDFSGAATVSYIAGANTTPPNGVKIVASLTDPAISSSPSALSVSQQSLFLRMGTDNLVRSDEKTLIYEKWYSVIVTDATGNAAANATIQAKLNSVAYRTGNWAIGTVNGLSAWVLRASPYILSEDLDKDGQCIASEDVNADGVLTPGNVASVNSNLQTDANGIAVVKVIYPKSFAVWTNVNLEVTATVGGSEGRASVAFDLPIAASDLRELTVPPPGEFSPFPYTNPRGAIRCGQ
jgi:hypothetical protein